MRTRFARTFSLLTVLSVTALATLAGPAHAAEPITSGTYPDARNDIQLAEYDSAGPAFTPPPLPDSRALPGSIDIRSIEVARTDAVTYVRLNIGDLFGYSRSVDRRASQIISMDAFPGWGYLSWGERPGAPIAESSCTPYPTGTSYSLPVTWSTTQEYVLFRFDNRCEIDDVNVVDDIEVTTRWVGQKIVDNRPNPAVRRQFIDNATTAP